MTDASTVAPTGPKRAATAAPLDAPRSVRATEQYIAEQLDTPASEESATQPAATASAITTAGPDQPVVNAGQPAQPVSRPDVTVADVDSVAAELEAVKPGSYAAVREQVRQEHIHYENQQIVALIPTWRDPAVRERESREMVEYAKSHGVTDAEIQTFNHYGDARTVALWHRDWQRHTQATRQPTRTARPGTAQPPAIKAYQAAAARAAKTGRRRDAMEAILHMGIISDTGN